MNCSWRQCFQDLHNCSSCRDSVEDLGTAPVTPDNWIPDVTMLHRMMLAGKDANGRPWPPPLDLELCEDIGTNGSRLDISKECEYHPGDGSFISHTLVHGRRRGDHSLILFCFPCGLVIAILFESHDIQSA
jgi:hypothetical protein